MNRSAAAPQAGHCPSLEELAAFIDGRLEGDERQRILAHLNRCERCYELFVDTVRAQQEEARSGGGGGGVDVDGAGEPYSGEGGPIRRGPWRRWPLAVGLAASLVVAAGLAVLLFSPGRTSTNAQELVAELAKRTDLARLDSVTSVLAIDRGLAEDQEAAERAFRLGVQLVDLAVDVSTEDLAAAQVQVGRSMALAEEEPFCATEEPAAYLELRAALAAGASRAALAGLVSAFESQLMGCLWEGEPWLPLGRWAAAGWLAATAGDATYFRPTAIRRFPARLQGAHDSYLADELAAVEAQLVEPPPVAQLPQLTAALEELIRKGGGRG